MGKGKTIKKIWLLTVLALFLSLADCQKSEKEKIFDQANKDLDQGSYAYALAGYQASIANETHLARSWRGAGICQLRLGNAAEAIQAFTTAMAAERNGIAMMKDLLAYRITAYLDLSQLQEAMEDCRTLLALAEPDADAYFLTGKVALAMDSYEEARAEFEQSWEAQPSYERAIQIYEAYVSSGMEADGTWFLEHALDNEAKTAQDYCDRGRVYYYMNDLGQAKSELIKASREGSREANLLLGMVYLENQDISNARAMYIQYNSDTQGSAKGYNGLALCDMAEQKYDAALENIQAGIPFADTQELQSLLFNEIVIYERRLDFATAREKAEEYTALFPDDAQVVREAAFLRSRT